MRALVTGAAGFMGSHVARHLLKADIEVVALDDLSGGYVENVPEDAEWIQGSVNDYPLLGDLFAAKHFDFVFHLAAYAAEGLSHFIRRFNYINNVDGSINLISLAVLNRVRLFVFTSSIAVYGSAQPPMTEDLIPHPEDPYGIAKYSVELDLQAARRKFGLEYVVFRPHNVYGEDQNIWDPYRNVIGIFIRQIRANRPLTIFGDGEQTRAFSYINDVAPVIAQSIKTPKAFGQVFNVGGEQRCTINHLAQLVSSAMGVPLRKVHLPPRLEVEHAYASHSRLREVFGTGEPTPLVEGLERTINWARSTGERPPRNPPRIEIPFRLPAGW